jgi:methanogenic corrinoid protein MtbC1
VTLRAWERRHDLLTPFRSDNRYRLYSDRDVAILRWIKNRVDGGVSISNAVNELRSMQKNGVWPEAIPTAPAATITASATPPERYASQFYQAILRHDETQAGDLLREAHAIFDLMTIFTQVIIPPLVDIGEAWYRGEIRVTTEHFASSFIRGRLLSLMQAYPSRRNAPYILVGCAPTEQHEIGSLMVAVLLRSTGYRVEYLGPDIPLDDLVDYAGFEHPALICLAASSESAAREMIGLQDRLNRLRPPVLLGYGGRAFDLQPVLRSKVGGNYLGSTLPDSLATIKSMLQRQR